MTVTGSREALKPVTPLENVLRVMKSARRNDELMAVWSDDVKAVEDAIAALSPDPAGVTLTLEEIARVMCKSRTCEGFKCCQWPGSGGRTNCPVKNGGYDDAATAILSLIQSKMGKP